MYAELNNSEFFAIQKIFFRETGIELPVSKKGLVQSRLVGRLLFYGLNSYLDYIRLVQINQSEKQEMINLITTNETYFFREFKQFDFFQKEIVAKHNGFSKFRFWSAASSVGAEAYSVAMVLDSYLMRNVWEIVGTDINSDVIKRARVGLYPIKWIDKIPDEYRKKYCLKGKGVYEGKFLIDRKLAEKIKFRVWNLMQYCDDIGKFDVIFLRNILIYFNGSAKQKVLDNILRNLKVGGFLFISLTENLSDLNRESLRCVDTSIFQKIGD